jgi:hypothetical protein
MPPTPICWKTTDIETRDPRIDGEEPSPSAHPWR